ncbi:hypothetical protein Nepgr_026181 [Nepenthes gracilis]|uniref:TOG domain-containing protein n=1 Tax=Nepenthes gracilis TaxID=150966 RepID=A0AAD3T7I5_NEPGR|nr:hypothetical protein Nepgr_026181 [Nepenthes gracilis]
MGSQGPKSSKPTKAQNQSTPLARSSSSSLSSHLAMVELKQRILNSLSKLSDRDTHQIAIEELEAIIQHLQHDAVPMLINCLFDASSSDPKPAVKKESLRLLAVLCDSHPDSTSTHLVKIVAHIAKRLRDPDSGVRDACCEAMGSLSAVYVKGDSENGVVSLFVRPLFDAMGENSKGVQVGAAICLGRVVECAKNPPVSAFQKLCPKLCKYLNSPNFMARSALLSVVAGLSQIGAIAPQSLEPLLQSIHECLASTDWATRKAAADTLTALALHSSELIKDGATSTLTALEACRFDKIKPVRDSITEALQLWKRIAGKAVDGASDEQNASSLDAENRGSGESSDKTNKKAADSFESKVSSVGKDLSNTDSSIADSDGKMKNGTISDKTVGILKKKAPALTDKELNPEFFQKLETRGSGELPVEVIVPRKCLTSSNSQEDATEQDHAHTRGNTGKGFTSLHSKQRDLDNFARDRWVNARVNGKDLRTRAFDIDDRNLGFSKADGQSEGSFMTNKGNWIAIQRQLLHLERQQAHLMNMLQDFMGGSHDSMVTLENRVRGLERVVEDMAQDLSVSSGRRGSVLMSGFEGSSIRPISRYNGLFDYAKSGRAGDGRIPFGDRLPPTDRISSIARARGTSWRFELPESRDYHSNGASINRRELGSNHMDNRSPRSDNESDQIGRRRAWDKGVGPIRLGEGPSARSVWQASKDEATLEAIRVAGEDNGTARTAQIAVAEATAEAMGNDNTDQERDPLWTSWRNAMDAIHVGDVDSAYAEVVSTGDDFLLIKLMERSGPVLDQLSNETANEILNAVLQLLLEPDLFDICLSWVQQLVEIVMENGPDVFAVPMEIKRELLFNLHEASSTLELPEDWEGASPVQLMLQLASAWAIDLQHHGS